MRKQHENEKELWMKAKRIRTVCKKPSRTFVICFHIVYVFHREKQYVFNKIKRVSRSFFWWEGGSRLGYRRPVSVYWHSSGFRSEGHDEETHIIMAGIISCSHRRKSGPEFLSSLAFQTILASVIFMKKSLLFILPLSPSFASTSLSPHLEKG